MRGLQTNDYENGKITINAVILTIADQKIRVFLQTREKAPFLGKLELPGGLLRSGETAEETLARKLKDVTGADGLFFQQFYTFTQPKRDPRFRAISISFIALLSYEKITNANDFYQIDVLPKLAFDHQEIISQAIESLCQNIDNHQVSQLMPKSFPLNDLQIVYEVIGQTKLDNRNFRKKILNSGDVVKAKIIQKNVHHRPAILYRFAK